MLFVDMELPLAEVILLKVLHTRLAVLVKSYSIKLLHSSATWITALPLLYPF